MTILEFMSGNPWLTAFLAIVAGWTVASCVQYARGIPDRPAKCAKCGYNPEDEE